MKLDLKSEKSMKPFGGVVSTLVPSGLDGVHFVLEPRYSQDDVCPFWYVTPTGDETHVNMSWSTVKVQLLAGADPLPPMTHAASRQVFKKAKFAGNQTASGARVWPSGSATRAEKKNEDEIEKKAVAASSATSAEKKREGDKEKNS